VNHFHAFYMHVRLVSGVSVVSVSVVTKQEFLLKTLPQTLDYHFLAFHLVTGIVVVNTTINIVDDISTLEHLTCPFCHLPSLQ